MVGDGGAGGVLLVAGGFVVGVEVAVLSFSSLLPDALDGVGAALVEAVTETVGVGVGVGTVVVVSEGMAERVGVSLATGVVTVGAPLSVTLGVTVKASGFAIEALGIGVLVVVLVNETEGVGVNVGRT